MSGYATNKPGVLQMLRMNGYFISLFKFVYIDIIVCKVLLANPSKLTNKHFHNNLQMLKVVETNAI